MKEIIKIRKLTSIFFAFNNFLISGQIIFVFFKVVNYIGKNVVGGGNDTEELMNLNI